MSKYLANAFSLQMIPLDKMGFISVVPISAEEVPADAESCIGHADTAAVVSAILCRSITPNRANIQMNVGDKLYVAQVVGGRLPEGATELPEGFELSFLKVEFAGTLCQGCKLDSNTSCVYCAAPDFFIDGTVSWGDKE